jgi:deoxyguanosine kinase
MSRSELLKEQKQEDLASPEKESHHLFVGLQGGVGSGKSELAQLMARRLSLTCLEEKFRENPFLAMFYDSPEEYSFESQTFFLKEKLSQMLSASEALKTGPLLIDPTLWQDMEIYVWTHRQMGWLSRSDHERYFELFRTLVEGKVIPEPDVVISVQAPVRVMRERIEKRGRDYELRMLKEYPDYFARVADRVREWVEDNPHQLPIIVVDSQQFNYATDPIDANEVISFIYQEMRNCLAENEAIILPAAFHSEIMADSRAGRFSKMDNSLRRGTGI